MQPSFKERFPIGRNPLRTALTACIVAFPAVCLSQVAPTHGGATAGKRIDEILAQLERRSDGLRDIGCSVKFVEDDRINLSKNEKQGRISFLMTEANPNFLIHFTKIAHDGVLGRPEWYLFDGRWLYQAIERLKQVTQQEVARPAEKVDLFDLEQAPFPLPFGQKKETILRHFDVSLVPPTAGDPPNTDHLVCVVKPGSPMVRKYDKLELFVLRDLHLPARVVVTKNKGYEVHTADFPDLSAESINRGIDGKAFAPPAAWKNDGYKFVVERLEPREGDTP
jgi:hypothetical protein